LRVALPASRRIAALIAEADPDSIHIATEGPIGFLVRRYCREHGLPFTTSFHTRFPDYISARVPIPEAWVWAVLRWFHRASQAVMAATPALAAELNQRGFRNVVLWPRGVDVGLFHPRPTDLDLPRPIFLSVGRIAVEKNLDAFLSLDLPGTKVVVGDGPARAALQQTYPVAAFPVTGPRDVIGEAPVGVLNEDLRSACLAALKIAPKAYLEFAASLTWEKSANTFVRNIAEARAAAKTDKSGVRPSAFRCLTCVRQLAGLLGSAIESGHGKFVARSRDVSGYRCGGASPGTCRSQNAASLIGGAR
jgi:hypothetical protein